MSNTNEFFTIKIPEEVIGEDKIIMKILYEGNIPSHGVCLDSQNDSFDVHTITKIVNEYSVIDFAINERRGRKVAYKLQQEK